LAKRVRGQRSTHRPGGVGPARLDRESTVVRRTLATPSAAPTDPGGSGSDATVVPGPVPTSSATRTSSLALRDARSRTRLRSGGLEQKASAEAGWVTEDLRRIAVISAIMLAGLALAWVLLVLVGLGDFY
jgi:hypothetical protein